MWAGLGTSYSLGVQHGVSDPHSLVHLVSCHTGDGFVTALGWLGRLRQLPPALAGGVTVPDSPTG